MSFNHTTEGHTNEIIEASRAKEDAPLDSLESKESRKVIERSRWVRKSLDSWLDSKALSNEIREVWES